MNSKARWLSLILVPALLGFGVWQKDAYRRYQDANDRLQLAMEGKAPPPIHSSEWLNSAPLTWKSLRGKVVLLDLWAYW